MTKVKFMGNFQMLFSSLEILSQNWVRKWKNLYLFYYSLAYQKLLMTLVRKLKKYLIESQVLFCVFKSPILSPFLKSDLTFH